MLVQGRGVVLVQGPVVLVQGPVVVLVAVILRLAVAVALSSAACALLNGSLVVVAVVVGGYTENCKCFITNFITQYTVVLLKVIFLFPKNII